ncbi:MAG: iron-containing alcohol dehydrogenase [Methanobacteriaceae archaeon]|nr:iron-containing alcohol dehydrogenase [Methanobacteriaceae archaeon]
MSNEAIDFSNLRKFVVPEFIYGSGARFLVGRYAKNFGANKVLIVTDPGIIKTGLVDDVISCLNSEEISSIIYSDVSPNPSIEQVMAGADIYKTKSCNVIIAIGGGSPMDCAKGIGIVHSNQMHIKEFEGADKVPIPGPPLICIPTTAGTSADVSQFAIISDREKKTKMAIVSKTVVPDVALIDPVTTLTMDPYLTACTSMDALTQSIEAYVSNASSHTTDLFALESIRIISEHITDTIQNPGNIELRDKMMLGSLYSGMAFSNASLGAVHAMALSLGGFLDLPHGECNAILLEHVVEFNFNSEPERFAKVGESMGLDLNGMSGKKVKSALIKKIKDLKESVGVNRTLKNVGVKEKDITELAKRSLEDACMITNPCRPSLKEIEGIFKNAL